MGSSSQTPLPRGDRTDAAAGARGRLKAFAVLQGVFWGGFLALRALASASYHPELFWTYMGPRLAIVALYAALTTAIHLAVNRFRSWSPTQRLMLTLVLCALSLYPMHIAEEVFARDFAPTWPKDHFLDYLSSFGWVLLAWAGYDFAQDWAHEVKRQAAALAHAQALAHAAHIKMLRYQLNPHFLFNSLNAISTLVLEQRNGEAEAMLLKLSRFLRHTIDSDPSQLALLGDEAQLQRLYLEMEAVRFGDKLQVLCNVPEALHDCLAPSLLLQPIIENAIKHGVAKAAAGGRIAIDASDRGGRLWLTVENEGPPYAPGASGLGLRNTRERLRAIYGEDARLHVIPRPEGGVRVEFDLPLMRAGQKKGAAARPPQYQGG